MAKSKKRTQTIGAAPQAGAFGHEGSTTAAPESRSENGHYERIAVRAYELYLARGGSHGQDWEDWLAAEREIVGQPNRD